ncbi:Ribose import ATP-binding protein RbsA [Ensifer adhaerens]|nr:Ribose import ATP-binding protein RbsA [Ensifer adhaerens]
MSQPVLSIKGATKSFGGTLALRGVDFTVNAGEVHALLGENGAGKSTLIKLLAGVHSTDEGEFLIAGEALPSGFRPQDVAAAGIRFVHQDFGLIDSMTVMENIALVAGFKHRFGAIDYQATAEHTTQQLAKLNVSFDPYALVGSLAIAEKAIVALARALSGDAKLIVVDEVAAALPSPDVARVHEVVRTAASQGVAFVYVSHRLEEVFQLCDRITVLRDGSLVAVAEVAGVDMAQVIEWIVGKSVSLERNAGNQSTGITRLNASDIQGGLVSAPLNLNIAAGEILGITGIIGSGYDSACAMIAGIDDCQTGRITVDDAAVAKNDAACSRAAGIEVVIGDRSRATFAERTVLENLFPDALFRRGSWPNPPAERQTANEYISEFNVRPIACRELPIQSLSGGNQQKILFARALKSNPKVVVLIDPTAGVDVGSREELHEMLRMAARQGVSVLLGSSDFEEIARVADRVVVMRDGRLSAEVTDQDVTWDRLFWEAHGGHGHAEPNTYIEQGIQS